MLCDAADAELVSVGIEFELVKLVTHRIPGATPRSPRNLQMIPRVSPGSLQAPGRRMGHSDGAGHDWPHSRNRLATFALEKRT